MTTPLHELAEQNRTDLAARTFDADVARRIRTAARVSVNMKPSALLRFLESGIRLNMWEFSRAESERTGDDFDSVLRTRLGEHYELRVDFEQRLGGDRRFHYGALNVGGMGTPRYGRYCVVDRRSHADTRPDPVWVAEDTLTGSRFRTPESGLDLERLREWTAPCDMAAELAATKLQASQHSLEPLHTRICSEADYIEALSVTGLQTADVEEVRSESDDTLQARALDALLGPPRESEQIDLELHARIRDRVDDLNITWTPWP